jgi:hypothetical protein
VQFSCDSHPFVDACFQARVEFSRELPNPQLIKRAEQQKNAVPVQRVGGSRFKWGGVPDPSVAPPLSDSPPNLLCRSACSPFCEPGLDHVPDQTPIALREREFICKARFQKYADTVMAC